tara:strand:+ start:72 stop:1709 length:1638 start_codon:yes stop_codon:yes gene_type:complete
MLEKNIVGAIVKGDISSIRALSQDEINTVFKEREFKELISPLFCAIQENELEIVNELLILGADTYLENSEGCNALIYAIKMQKDYDLIELLMDHCSVEDTDSFGKSALHYAVIKNNHILVKTLLINTKRAIVDNLGKTPGHYAIHSKNNGIIFDLLNHNYENLVEFKVKRYNEIKDKAGNSIDDLLVMNKSEDDFKRDNALTRAFANLEKKIEDLEMGEIKILTPIEINNVINKKVIRQEKAKQDISRAIFYHLNSIKGVKVKKSNVLMMGPSGSGKTEMLKAIGEELGIPVHIVDCTQLTGSGYKGNNINSIFKSLLDLSGGDTLLAERSIVILDEFDKIRLNSSQPENIRIQTELLKTIEGGSYSLADKSYGEPETINTENMLFIAAGAFTYMKDEKERPKKSIGIVKAEEESKEFCFSSVTNEDLIKEGFLQELIGRFNIKTYTEELKEDDLVKILTEIEDSSYNSYLNILKAFNVDIKVEESFFTKIAKKAVKKGVGARGLNSILEEELSIYIDNIEDYSNKSIYLKGDIDEQKNQKKELY